MTLIRINSHVRKYPVCGSQNALPDVPYFVNGQASASKGSQLHWRQESSINYTASIISYYSLYNAQHYSVSELEKNRKRPDLDYKAGRDSLSIRQWKQQNTLFLYTVIEEIEQITLIPLGPRLTKLIVTDSSVTSNWNYFLDILTHLGISACLGNILTYPLANLCASFPFDLVFLSAKTDSTFAEKESRVWHVLWRCITLKLD